MAGELARQFAIPWIVLVAMFVSGTLPVLAEDESADDDRNLLGAYLGVTTSGDEEGVSVGIEYERRLSARFGIGAVIEHTGADFRENIVAVSFAWHPWKELKLFAAPGVAIETAEASSEALLRVGVDYGLGIGKGFEIAPGIAFDFTESENSVVIGAVFSKSF